tara:strand:- start:123 stop:842 length:720 start_codon:yes stop_codon:yes gene_type:complete
MVNVDTVYQRVLALANKEQRGYITPQEFNLYANQAQLDIFEQYFYDLNQFKRIPGNDSNYTDMVGLIEEKLKFFKQENQVVISEQDLGDIYKISNVYFLPDTFNYSVDSWDASGVVEEIQAEDLISTQISPLTRATNRRPIYFLRNNKISFIPTAITGFHYRMRVINKPGVVNWAYIVVDGKPVVNLSASDYSDFQLHGSEEVKLVIKILQLAGITLKDTSLYQIAGAEDNKNIQQEKQ